jgi:hypothetical protein
VDYRSLLLGQRDEAGDEGARTQDTTQRGAAARDDVALARLLVARATEQDQAEGDDHARAAGEAGRDDR